MIKFLKELRECDPIIVMWIVLLFMGVLLGIQKTVEKVFSPVKTVEQLEAEKGLVEKKIELEKLKEKK
ncbi:MAG: hypothetical protein KDD43_00015 [Bdellovibrionales bacterium]|nr:hypothetical protein [Bdellovibrionales bacterium]